MKTVLLRAPTLSQSGYGVHARQIFRWLESKGQFKVYSQIVNWGNTPWYVNPSACGGMVGRIMSTTNGAPSSFDATIQLQLPDEWDAGLSRVNVGVSAVVETDICNPKWIESCNKMTSVIVPSQFSKDVLIKSSHTTPLRVSVGVVPEAFTDSIVEGAVVPDLPLTTSFNFLVVAQTTATLPEHDRKNIINTVRWLCQEFADDADVGVIVKTNSGRSTTIDKEITSRHLRAAVGDLKTKVRVYMLHGDMTDSEVAGLYVHPRIRALVSATRGEGFGLPLVEAAASGLPVIATGWSAHTEFLGKNYTSIAHTLVPVPRDRIDNRIFVEGAKWADPTESDFKKRVRKFKSSPDVPRQWAAELRETIQKSYGWPAVSNAYDKELLPIIG